MCKYLGSNFLGAIPPFTDERNRIMEQNYFSPKKNHWSLLYVLTLWLLGVRYYLIKRGWASTTQPFFFIGDMSPEREIEYQKLVNAILLEVFNRQK
jgi:hypothetical protein